MDETKMPAAAGSSKSAGDATTLFGDATDIAQSLASGVQTAIESAGELSDNVRDGFQELTLETRVDSDSDTQKSSTEEGTTKDGDSSLSSSVVSDVLLNENDSHVVFHRSDRTSDITTPGSASNNNSVIASPASAIKVANISPRDSGRAIETAHSTDSHAANQPRGLTSDSMMAPGHVTSNPPNIMPPLGHADSSTIFASPRATSDAPDAADSPHADPSNEVPVGGHEEATPSNLASTSTSTTTGTLYHSHLAQPGHNTHVDGWQTLVQQEFATLRQENIALHRQNATLQQQVETLRQENTTLQQQQTIDTLRQENTTLQQQQPIDTLRQENAALQQQQQQIDTLERRNAALQLAGCSIVAFILVVVGYKKALV
jgi:hypothetical protein